MNTYRIDISVFVQIHEEDLERYTEELNEVIDYDAMKVSPPVKLTDDQVEKELGHEA